MTSTILCVCVHLCVCVCVCVCAATVVLPSSVLWVKLNYRNTGFYMVHYGDQGWARLTDALSTNINTLTHQDRASLTHTIFALSRSVCVCVCVFVLLIERMRETVRFKCIDLSVLPSFYISLLSSSTSSSRSEEHTSELQSR